MAEERYCSIELAKIVSANSSTRIYEVMPLFKQVGPVLPLRAVALGSSGNASSDAQVTPPYSAGDVVLIAYQPTRFVVERMPLAYILGKAPYDIFIGKDPKEWVRSGHLGFANISPLNFKGLDLLEATVRPNRLIQTNTGHGSADLPPGTYEVASKLTSLVVGDYLTGISALGAELWVEPVMRRIIEQSWLRSIYTINSVEDTALVNDSVIVTHKSSGNSQDPFFKCLEETEEGVMPRGVDLEKVKPGALDPKTLNCKIKPFYRDIKQSGDILYGEHRTVLSEDQKTPLYREFLGLDGSRHMLSATGFSITKTPYIKSVIYSGERVTTPKVQEGKYPEPSDPENPWGDLDTSDDTLWTVYGNKTLDTDDFGLPTEFLDIGLAEYPADNPTELPDSLLNSEKKLPIYPKTAYIDFEEDGSLLLRDGWGSYIYLHRGNIEVHAANNLFFVGNRDILSFAGANQTLYANQDVSVQGGSGYVEIAAGSDLQLGAGIGDQRNNGRVTIESKKEVAVLGGSFSVDALHQIFRCRDIKVPGQISGKGSFSVVAPNESHISMQTAVMRLEAEQSLAIYTTMRALVMDNLNVSVAGDIRLLGGLCISDDKSLSFNGLSPSAFGPVSRQFSAGTYPDIVNTVGGLHVSGQVLAQGDIQTTGSVVGNFVMALEPGDGKLHKPKGGSGPIIENVSTYSELKTRKQASPGTVPDTPARYTLQDKLFCFTEPSQACSYTLVVKQPAKGFATTSNKGYEVAGVDDKSYIYPGTAFWTVNGLKDYDGKTLGGFNQLKWARANNIDAGKD